MLFLKFLETIFSLSCLFGASLQLEQVLSKFRVADEAEYINSFSTLIKDSYSADLPQELEKQCKSQQQFLAQNLPTQSITGSVTSEQVQRLCGTNTICTIEKGATVTMNSNLNVAALFVKGFLSWNDQTQNADQQWLCAGYVVVI